MNSSPVRRSDRILIELPIVVTGSDATGAVFLAPGRTAVIGRYGAKIVLQPKLAPHQEVTIRCVPTAKEVDARIIGPVGVMPDGSTCYGIELLDTDIDIWEIGFPPPDQAEGAAGRALLECTRCHLRELVYLNEIEAEVLEVNKGLSRHCKKCVDLSIWKETRLKTDEELPGETPQVLVALPPPPPRRTKDGRKHVRRDVRVSVCIRHPQYGEEVAETVNISRGGFRFKSSRHYREGWIIEVALPYNTSGANIFAAARVVFAAELPEGGESVYGVMYLPNKEGWPGR